MDSFWEKIIKVFSENGKNNKINSLEYILIGYKIMYKQYEIINVILSQIGYSI